MGHGSRNALSHLAAELIGTDLNPFLATVGLLHGSVALLEGEIPAVRVHELEQRLPD